MDYETLRGSMTVEDAAEVLRNTRCFGTMDIAKNVILKALEAQPSEHTEERTETHACDCISRKDIGLTNLEILMCNGDYKEALKMLLDKIEKAPSVTPQPKVGRWIGHREHCEKLGVIPSGLAVYEWCSNCGNGIDVRDWSRISHNYCPGCGSYNGGAK